MREGVVIVCIDFNPASTANSNDDMVAQASAWTSKLRTNWPGTLGMIASLGG